MINLDEMHPRTLVTIDFFRLNDVLVKMVRNGQISNAEREDLLHKSGLTKLEDGKWQENENCILGLIES